MDFVRHFRRPPRFVAAPRVLLALLATTCVAPTASAGEPKSTESTQQGDSDVKTLMRRGLAAQESGDNEAARTLFLQAWAQKQHFAIAVSLAEVEMALGHYEAAANYWEYYLDHLPEDLAERRPNAQEQLETCRAHLGRLHILAPPGATLSVDGEVVGTAPLEEDLWASTGKHEIGVQDAEGGQTSKAVVVNAGESHIVDLELSALPPPSEPQASPTVEPASPTPTNGTQSELSETPSNSRVLVLAGGAALTLAATGIGVGYWLRSASLADEVRDLQRQVELQGDPALLEPAKVCLPADRPAVCSQLEQRIHQHNRAANTSLIAFSVAGGLAVVTTTTYLLWPTNDEDPEASRRNKPLVAPWFSPKAAGLTVFTEF